MLLRRLHAELDQAPDAGLERRLGGPRRPASDVPLGLRRWNEFDGGEPDAHLLGQRPLHRAPDHVRRRPRDRLEPLTITVGSAPTARILTPDAGTTFRAGDTISYSGEGSDPEDGTLPGSSLSWRVVFHHGSHVHPVLDSTPGSSGRIRIPTSGHSFSGNTSFEIVLTAEDSDGIQSSDSVTIRPEKTNLTLATSPSGLNLTIDGVSATAPVVRDELVGFQLAVDAPSPQFVGGSRDDFASWSDGGARARTVTVPAIDTTLTARYTLATSAPAGLVAALTIEA